MIKIVTDSSAHLPPRDYDRLGITVVPLHVIFGDELYTEGVDMSNDKFYHMLKHSPHHPSTTQPSVGEFLEVYRPLVEAGHSIISIHLSSKLSGTYSSALAAQRMLPDADISVVDTEWVTFALGLIVRDAALAARGGQSKQEILALVDRLNHKMNIFFVVDTLEYLQKGGRIGGAQALLGTLLKIKPILTLENGRVEAFEKVRSKPGAVRRMLDVMGDRLNHGGQFGDLHVGVLHSQAAHEAQQLQDEICGRFQVAEAFHGELGPVIGVHTGPGTLGVVFYTDEPGE